MGSNLFQIRRIVFGFSAVGGAGLLVAAGFIGYCAYTLPLLRAPAAELPPAALLYTAGTGVPFAARGVYRGERITADHLPADLAHAVVAIEDRRFYQHDGVDPRGILRATWHDLWSPGRVEGASTITQQLARLTYLSPERSLRRKVQEVMVALWLEARLGKDEILARYLNSVYFGAGAYGADAAAKRYFGKKAGDLDLAESAMLAGLIRAPSHLAPTRNLEAARRRAELVLQVMVETGAIDEARAVAARAQPVQLAIPPDTEPDDNYFIDAAEAEVKRLVGAPPLDLGVATTFDQRLQDAAAKTVKRWLTGEGAKRHVGQAALVALAPDGAVLAMVGGRDYGESQFNRATQAKRQPGSLFKIFVYLTALSSGYTQDSVIVDQPIQIGDWQPKNYDGRYHGAVSLKSAFAQSLNTVSAQLVQALGVKRVIDMAHSLGVHSDLPAVPSLALGSAEVTLIEMVRAMAAIATDTKTIEPYMVRAIRAEAAAPLYTRPETSVDRPQWNRAAMLPLLEAVVTEGTGKAARLDRRSAGKTGTTDEYHDAWFVGFTSEIVVGVWVGNDDNSPTDRVTGGDIPAKIWHDFVTEAERIMALPKAPAAPAATAPSATAAPSAPAPPALPSAAAVNPVQSSALAGPAPPASAPPAAAPAGVRGVPVVVDTATLRINGVLVRLNGVAGEAGEAAQNLSRYIAGREVACEPVERGAPQFSCIIGDYDLGEAILLNGAGRAAGDAPERLRGAEQQARLAGRGIWGR
jgi:penicillin-binding protein 1A